MKMETDTMYKVTIDDRAVKFIVSEKLASQGTRWNYGREETRWDEVEVVKTKKGKFVLGRYYITCWQGESGSKSYEVFDLLDDLVAALDATGDLDRQVLDELGKLEDVSEEV